MEKDWFEYAKKLEGSLKRKEIEIEGLKTRKGIFVTKAKFKDWTEKENNFDKLNFDYHAEKMRANLFEDAGKIIQSKLDASQEQVKGLRESINNAERPHTHGCPVTNDVLADCNCGLEYALIPTDTPTVTKKEVVETPEAILMIDCWSCKNPFDSNEHDCECPHCKAWNDSDGPGIETPVETGPSNDELKKSVSNLNAEITLTPWHTLQLSEDLVRDISKGYLYTHQHKVKLQQLVIATINKHVLKFTESEPDSKGET